MTLQEQIKSAFDNIYQFNGDEFTRLQIFELFQSGWRSCAKEMEEKIIKQSEALKVAKEALDYYARISLHDNSLATEALATIEELEK